ncbi:hypothetical protein DAEQUDRAFT_728340 [Daedalea quercina L-15889]|uniref:Uncharacterized protein n=1 Tax=Daedalea quercina L-15889 TaxID=1314783 RepID=A0A165PDC3_9APHY|nr:hypothetical protein DAEQUDRAFT_728340 [Daedalea quercina L-15889]
MTIAGRRPSHGGTHVPTSPQFPARSCTQGTIPAWALDRTLAGVPIMDYGFGFSFSHLMYMSLEVAQHPRPRTNPALDSKR